MRVKKSGKYLAMVMVLVLFCAFPVPVKATLTTPAEEIQILAWENTSSILSGITFSGSTANCSCSVNGYSGTTNVSATYELQQKINGTFYTIKTWSASASRAYLDWSGSYSVSSGYTYRLYITALVTRNGTTETVNSSVTATLN